MGTNDYTSDNVTNVGNTIANTTDTQLLAFQIQILNNYTTLYDKVKSENDRIQKTYDKIKNEHSADSQKSKYVELSEIILKRVYMYSFVIYMILSLVLCVLIYYKPFSLTIKIGLVIVILGFPFYIFFLENLIYQITMYLYNLALSTVYTNGYSNTNLEYSGQAMGEVMSQTAKSPPLKTVF